LFWRIDETPFLFSLRELIKSESPSAAYIGASNDDNPDYHSIFESAMESIGIEDRRMISSSLSSDEAEADVQSRIEVIQQNEIDQIREMGLFLDNELNYAEQYAQILRDVKDNWPGKCVLPNFFIV